MHELKNKLDVNIEASINGSALYLKIEDNGGQWVPMGPDKAIEDEFDAGHAATHVSLNLSLRDAQKNVDGIWGVSANPGGQLVAWPNQKQLVVPANSGGLERELFAIFVKYGGEWYMSDPIMYIRRK
jgi:hypothetical protein